MTSFRIKTINAIAPEGLELLGDEYAVDPDDTNPHGNCGSQFSGGCG